MASNYEAICRENRENYGKKGAQKSGKLAAELYDDRTHFIFELLQNAEDALGRRGKWHGSRKVSFTLTPNSLILSHFGKPFDEADVRSVCEISESTKNESSIGRFGLGFKSVYTVTDLPEIHSGDESFTIDNYVYPKSLERLPHAADETLIILPLRPEDVSATNDITTGFRQLGPRSLLFLRNIEEISWCVEAGSSGFFRRHIPEQLGSNVQRINVVGKEGDEPEVDQNWLVFHRDVYSTEHHKVGRVEIAFLLLAVKDAPDHWSVQPLAKSPLVVFFPTVVESHLGFLVQGPYKTTPSRDNIPPSEPWNQYLVKETSDLLTEAMCWMRDKAMLDIAAMRCLPLDREKFPKDSRFAPMFDAVRQAFLNQELLPTFTGEHVTALQVKLARTQELRELFSPEQVEALFNTKVSAWLSGEITKDRTPEIHDYLTNELDIEEITSIKLVRKLTKTFLEEQTDAWVLSLYEYLSGQERTLRSSLATIPLIRLDDGTHVVAHENGKAKAFLPCTISTSFPTMRRAVCNTPEVRTFLVSLGITEPDPVDDVIWNVLPKYQEQELDVFMDAYATDIKRILTAFNTDSSVRKEKLKSTLRDTNFVMVLDTGTGQSYRAKPRETYISSDRLLQLFAGVSDVWIVDNNYACLRGEGIRELLISCGASRYLIPQATPSRLDATTKEQIRREAGLVRASWESPPEDFTLRGLSQLLELLPTLKPEETSARVKVLWEALADLEARGTNTFFGTYKWGYFHETKSARFDAAFVQMLNQQSWVPNANGELVPPRFVVFDTLGWKPSPFLQSKIIFKAPIIDQLAKEAGIDPAILELLRRDPTIVAELASRLHTNPSPAPETEVITSSDGNIYDDESIEAGVRVGDQGRTGISHGEVMGNRGSHGRSSGHSSNGDKVGGNGNEPRKRTPGHAGGRPFISYVGVHPDDIQEIDDVDQETRMKIEAKAIDLIVRLEPTLNRTPEGNPGFDLYETDCCGNKCRWVEVKAMTGTLEDRPVGLSHIQFNHAREKGDAYWLYVVEHATDPMHARVLRIQNPAAKAQTFTFDHGWREIASMKY
ncbi:sacsin N-terminal ATP-binding-like domain-containing protein [Shewanella algae]|uniref:sacsin N-terminal ATP-binding-like domain-containing protein n=1 Tax=Shewanella algae TaxID=38313 RepID=UPI001AAF72A5|nr:DUF3883 domain-containing protein [Shewanella algae]MBO2694662.1 DUF3883 domain-containing protein [Shewanella algae]